MSNDVIINGATDRSSIRCHKIYKDNRESLNRRLLPESPFYDKYFSYMHCGDWQFKA